MDLFIYLFAYLFIYLFYLAAWTGVSSLSTKFLILQYYFFDMHISMHKHNKIYSTQYTSKVRNRNDLPKHLNSIFSTSILL